MNNHIHAPWTPDQVDALNRYQRAGFVHPFTCANMHDGDRELVATRKGWICTNCSYTQNWAHGGMLERPVNPIEALFMARSVAGKRAPETANDVIIKEVCGKVADLYQRLRYAVTNKALPETGRIICNNFAADVAKINALLNKYGRPETINVRQLVNELERE